MGADSKSASSLRTVEFTVHHILSIASFILKATSIILKITEKRDTLMVGCSIESMAFLFRFE